MKHLWRLPEVWRAVGRSSNWLPFTLGYIFPTRRVYPWELHLRDGFSLKLENFHDLVTAWVIFCRDEYVVPAEAKLVIDIGANYGAFTLLAAASAPDAKIVSVEPFPDVFARLQEHVTSHGLDGRVICIQGAVCAAPGLRYMDGSGSVSQSRGILPLEESGRESAVPVVSITLPDLLNRVASEAGRERIDLVKMDIEGGEHELLRLVSPEQLSHVDEWQMEYHPNGPHGPIFAVLEQAGFRCVRDKRTSPDSGVAHFVRVQKLVGAR